MRLAAVVLVACLAAAHAPAGEAPSVPVDVLLRMRGTSLESSPAVQAALRRALEENRGTPRFLELVRAFDLRDQQPGLLELAAALPRESAGIEALQRTLDQDGIAPVRSALAGPAAAGLIDALGGVPDDRVVDELLRPMVASETVTPALRSAALQSLARTESGSRALLDLAADGTLTGELRAETARLLSNSFWPAVREAAATVFPAAEAAGEREPLATLLARPASASRGESLFFGKAACAACHLSKGRGTDFGPDLTTIGDKFGKPAMHLNIVDPGAGIVFGYEPWQLELRNGVAVGVISSETADEITLKTPGGVVIRHNRADVLSVTRLPASLMPEGLLDSLDNQEVADLLEYLASLRAVPAAGR